MTHIRLPVVAENILPDFSGPATVGSTLDDVGRAVDELLALGYAVSVDMHPDAEFSALLSRQPARAKKALAKGWRRLARNLARWPADLVFAELLNEPATTDEIWRPMAQALIEELRAELPQSYLIIGSAPYQRLDALAGWTPLAGQRIIYACHYYDPMLFTHQGSDWDKEAAWGRVSGVPFPSRSADPVLLRLADSAQGRGDEELAVELRKMAEQAHDGKAIHADFALVGQWSAGHAAPVIVNEFGVLRGVAKRADRLAWLAATRKAAETQGFGWAHWDYAQGFGLLDEDGAIDDGVIGALFSS